MRKEIGEKGEGEYLWISIFVCIETILEGSVILPVDGMYRFGETQFPLSSSFVFPILVSFDWPIMYKPYQMRDTYYKYLIVKI